MKGVEELKSFHELFDRFGALLLELDEISGLSAGDPVFIVRSTCGRMHTGKISCRRGVFLRFEVINGGWRSFDILRRILARYSYGLYDVYVDGGEIAFHLKKPAGVEGFDRLIKAVEKNARKLYVALSRRYPISAASAEVFTLLGGDSSYTVNYIYKICDSDAEDLLRILHMAEEELEIHGEELNIYITNETSYPRILGNHCITLDKTIYTATRNKK